MDKHILIQAVRWFDQAHELSAEQQRQFELWLSEDERHLEAYHRMEKLFLDDDVDIALLQAQRNLQHSPATASNTSSVKNALLNVWQKIVQSVNPSAIGGLAMAAVLIVLVVLPLYQPSPSSPTEALQPLSASYSSEVGQRENYSLPDGSILHLNANSVIEMNFSATERKLVLQRGEAYFEISSDPARPLTVSAGDTLIRGSRNRIQCRTTQRSNPYPSQRRGGTGHRH